MISRVVLAQLSPTMEEGTIVKWSKKEGDAVKVGDVLAEIETDKANMEMEALAPGVLRKILVPAGGKAPVGALIGVVADPKEDISGVLAQSPAAGAPVVAPAAAPAVPAPAASAAAPLAAPPGDGRVKASPLARTMAERQNIPLAEVPGTGPGGRIVKRDIESYAAAPPGARAVSAAHAPAGAPAPLVPFPAVVPGQELPLSNMRKTIARRLAESKFSAPHFYVTVDVDMGAAVALREQLLNGENVKVSFNDLVLKACAKASLGSPWSTPPGAATKSPPTARSISGSRSRSRKASSPRSCATPTASPSSRSPGR